MKKMVFIWAMAICIFGAPALADELKADMKASDWSFKDADDKVFTMETWAGKVLMINYVDPDESDLNEHFTDAMKKAKDAGRLTDQHYKGIGIADCAATWKPNFAIRAIAGKKAKKYKTVILFDYDASLRNSWGLAKDTSNIIVVDKNRVCRAVIRGRVDDGMVDKLIQLVVDLQKQ
ncbi:YtfJ family protein [Thermodesulfobacteriota bacterium]